jgi:hypothetical protein
VNPYLIQGWARSFISFILLSRAFITVLVLPETRAAISSHSSLTLVCPPSCPQPVPAIPVLEASQPVQALPPKELVVAILDKVSQLFNEKSWLSRHRRCDQLSSWYLVSGKLCPIKRRAANNMTLAPIPAGHRAATANQTRRSSSFGG